MAARVLVVEDDPEFKTTLEYLLTSKGHDVEVVNNGAEAISFLEENEHPDVVLVDLLMPGIVGGELLEYLKDDDTLASIPVAIVSASPQLAPDGYPVFRKPIDPRSLLDFVDGASTRAGW